MKTFLNTTINYGAKVYKWAPKREREKEKNSSFVKHSSTYGSQDSKDIR